MASAVLYARYSPRPRKRRGVELLCESIETQTERMRAWCQAFGHEIVGEHRDEGISGAEVDGRAGLLAAVAQACQERAILVVYSLSRFSRDTVDALTLERRLRKAGARLAMLDLGVDTSRPFGRFAFTVWAAQAALEREVTIERTSDAMKRHQDAGRRMSAAMGRPFGHEDRSCLPFGRAMDPADPSRMVWNESELATLQRIRQLAGDGLTMRAIARELNASGELCRGRRWHHQQIKRLLTRTHIAAP